jgi:hypothetical protein
LEEQRSVATAEWGDSLRQPWGIRSVLIDESPVAARQIVDFGGIVEKSGWVLLILIVQAVVTGVAIAIKYPDWEQIATSVVIVGGIGIYVLELSQASLGRRRGQLSIRCQYISNRQQSYAKATEIVAKARSEIINVNTTRPLPEIQDKLYDAIKTKLEANRHLIFRRAVVLEADDEMRNIRLILEKLGRLKNFSLSILTGRVAIPSCVISDHGAIIGFNDPAGRITRSLYVPAPSELIGAIREHYESRLSDERFFVSVKDVDDEIASDKIEARIRHAVLKIRARD